MFPRFKIQIDAHYEEENFEGHKIKFVCINFKVLC